MNLLTRSGLSVSLTSALCLLGCDFSGNAPDDSQPAASLAAQVSLAEPPPAGALLLNSSLDNEDPACWNYRPNSGGYNRAGCGGFSNIGSWTTTLAEGSVRRGPGMKSIRIEYSKNEDVGGVSVGVNTDVLHVRAYYYFYPGYDFGQGMKIGRASSFNSSTQLNEMDIILVARSANGGNQCGMNDMKDLGLYFNGCPKGYDWGNVAAPVSFQRGRWYAVEYRIKLNTPGARDGEVMLWVNGALVASRTGMNLRGYATSQTMLNSVRLGGWYSNSAYGNPCPNPSQPSRYYMDDVVVSKEYIGP